MNKRFAAAQKEIDVTKQYSVEEAVALAKKTSTTKFVGNIEVHVRTGIDPKKSDQLIRSTVTLPHGTGKIKKVAVFKGTEGELLIKKIKETGQIDFDIAVADPAIMPKLAVIAKILGPKGLMPNPKSGTVTADTDKAVKEFAAGRTEFKNDDSGNIHMLLGKSNFSDEQIVANYKSFMDALHSNKPAGLKKEYIVSVTLNSSMGPGIKVKI
ncbi:MAG: 50S ribosomal protein L1 [Candidatus Doudnabacteria bacterium RIFCSPLOWO2_02_FULL_42_9]|uniref:Ribosomal protein n=1 Tax=Candidatus Doudnabacteria bacterium RIFCSPHIGHO2_01_FULL_41_86 TaxID=1817821 RepID=A0A1F5N8T2_9BACT|nr:MAG: 50S ribosomal protein L1 [Candidatus Doudnabacteria bacterium RIFCSPHIGHO2_01_FULL_41_86]OGE75849.1 MAG: 50S ribosomal protein L1 [Candidatus Doudnabacteria bacterium RIFCSPHIGHO2_01_43_10]OGE86223.1 MAG: 50S ribosomal protein L1 [Candidatus Doudnabacteria bacterium RIFCSPHIGHO2_12_FULL_42_22]OGE87072.1 MAG: 50S ribosomal protein L1 [Candidatus Doudnabacteria bacterium RIFCSPHIGHO2_02_FULL_42_25]OGE92211.1 MAG: 50S ribosomal protein L1 [Candidatus Doudnabacteria bacterium RIFCSPLOWO2_01